MWAPGYYARWPFRLLPLLQEQDEQAARAVDAANGRQASLVNRRESIEKMTEVQIVGELQALQTVADKVAGDLVAARDRLAVLELDDIPKNRVEPVEKLTKGYLAFELRELLTVVENAARDLGVANSQQASLSRMAIGRLTKEEIAGELQVLQTAAVRTAKDLVKAFGKASLENRYGSINVVNEKLMKEKLAGELQALHTATEKAARDLAAHFVLPPSIEKFTKPRSPPNNSPY